MKIERTVQEQIIHDQMVSMGWVSADMVSWPPTRDPPLPPPKTHIPSIWNSPSYHGDLSHLWINLIPDENDVVEEEVMIDRRIFPSYRYARVSKKYRIGEMLLIDDVCIVREGVEKESGEKVLVIFATETVSVHHSFVFDEIVDIWRMFDGVESIVKVIDSFVEMKGISIVVESNDPITEVVGRLEVYDENVVRHISMQLVNAISVIHANSFVHGDIHVDNIRSKGVDHVKLGGLLHIQKVGIFRNNLNKRINAPEVKSKFWDQKLDIWALGTALYYLLTGEEYQTTDNISEASISEPTKCFLKSLVNEIPEQRPVIESLKNHPWFSDTINNVLLPITFPKKIYSKKYEQ